MTSSNVTPRVSDRRLFFSSLNRKFTHQCTYIVRPLSTICFPDSPFLRLSFSPSFDINRAGLDNILHTQNSVTTPHILLYPNPFRSVAPYLHYQVCYAAFAVSRSSITDLPVIDSRNLYNSSGGLHNVRLSRIQEIFARYRADFVL